MARIAILTLEQAGHLIPTGCVGLELQRRGHDVTVVTHEQGRSLVQQLGLAFQPSAPYPTSGARLSRAKRLAAFVQHAAVAPAQLRLMTQATAILRDVPDRLRGLRADLIICDQNPLAGATVAEHLGLPYVSVFSALLAHEEPFIPPVHTSWPYQTSHWARWRNLAGHWGFHLHIRPVLSLINRQRAAWGLPPRKLKSDHYSPLAQISPLVRELDFPREQLPAVCHYVGSLGANRPEAVETFPWDRLDGRPLVYASLGTMSSRKNAQVLRRIEAACGELDVQLVLALGKWREATGSARELLGTLSPSTIAVDFAPQMALLRKAALLVTHAGQNTVMEAISQGVPMVALPRKGDQPGVAARVEYSGVGLCESFKQVDSRRLRTKIERVLREDAFRRRAGQLREASVRAGGAARAADIVEWVLAERRPLTRDVVAQWGDTKCSPLSLVTVANSLRPGSLATDWHGQQKRHGQEEKRPGNQGQGDS